MTRVRPYVALRALLLLWLAAAACGQQEPAELDPSAWLASVQSAHARADAALAAGDIARAQSLLERAAESPPPSGVRHDDARVVYQDLQFRLGQLELARGAPEASLLRAERGLGLGRADDLFTANLLVVRGRALAALGRDIEAASSDQDALGINARLLTLKKAAGGDTENLRKEIASTQRVVEESIHSINRFARELDLPSLTSRTPSKPG